MNYKQLLKVSEGQYDLDLGYEDIKMLSNNVLYVAL